jgi:hypothetical protein
MYIYIPAPIRRTENNTHGIITLTAFPCVFWGVASGTVEFSI